MAFVTIEDLYGNAEVLVFENAYLKAGNCLVEENIVIVEGRYNTYKRSFCYRRKHSSKKGSWSKSYCRKYKF